MALHDQHGNAIFTDYLFQKHCGIPLEAEFHAYMEGLELALLSIIVETDCSKLIACTKNKSQDASPLPHLV
jgi:hypothetical protein